MACCAISLQFARCGTPRYTWSRCERLGPHEATRLTIHFLDRNLETLLEVLGNTSVEKDVVERDRLLQRAAADPTLIHRALDKMPSWASFVATVTRLVRGP